MGLSPSRTNRVHFVRARRLLPLVSARDDSLRLAMVIPFPLPSSRLSVKDPELTTFGQLLTPSLESKSHHFDFLLFFDFLPFDFRLFLQLCAVRENAAWDFFSSHRYPYHFCYCPISRPGWSLIIYQ
jgi:hypothetical protein